jgi:uncharacterized protein YndB with AHSA1/START domain
MSSTTAPTTSVQVHRVHIRATPEAIWEAITSPEWTKRYGYHSPAEYDLRPGGTYRGLPSEEMVAHGMPAGSAVIDGDVLEADPPRRLVQTWRMLFTPELVAEGFTRLTYEIEPERDGVTMLTITHDVTNAPITAASVSAPPSDAGGGWSVILSDLKTLLESGEPLYR